MHGGRHGGDDVGVHTGSAILPAHVAVCAASTACPRKSVWRSVNRGLMPEGTTPLALKTLPPSTLLVAEIPADTTLVQCSQLNQSLHAAAAAVGRLLVVLTSALALLLLSGTTILPLLLLLLRLL